VVPDVRRNSPGLLQPFGLAQRGHSRPSANVASVISTAPLEESDMPTWNRWDGPKPAKDQLVDLLFPDGHERHSYRYAGGVVLLMPPDHTMSTYATPAYWRPAKGA
jgi:hypothetical protein